jgi:hypothetical protein
MNPDDAWNFALDKYGDLYGEDMVLGTLRHVWSVAITRRLNRGNTRYVSRIKIFQLIHRLNGFNGEMITDEDENFIFVLKPERFDN